MTSAIQCSSFAFPIQQDLDNKETFNLKRMSLSGGAVFYQARTSIPRFSHSTPRKSPNTVSDNQTKLQPLVSLPQPNLLLISLSILLVLLFLSSIYLVLRLDNLQEKMDINSPSRMDDLTRLLKTHSSKHIKEYFKENLEQISKVRWSTTTKTDFILMF